MSGRYKRVIRLRSEVAESSSVTVPAHFGRRENLPSRGTGLLRPRAAGVYPVGKRNRLWSRCRFHFEVFVHQGRPRHVWIREAIPKIQVELRQVFIPNLMSDVRMAEYSARRDIRRSCPHRHGRIFVNQYDELVRLLQPENRRTVRRSRCRSQKRLRGGQDRRSDVAHAAPHFCLTSSRAGSGHHDGEGTVGTLDGDRHDALHAYGSHFEGGCRGKTGGRCFNSATPCTKMQQFESPL